LWYCIQDKENDPLYSQRNYEGTNSGETYTSYGLYADRCTDESAKTWNEVNAGKEGFVPIACSDEAGIDE